VRLFEAPLENSMLGKFAFVALTALMAVTKADAADMPTKTSYHQSYNWTGCYLGIQGGGGWSQNEWGDSTLTAAFRLGPLGAARAYGWLAGGQIGCDYQTGALVFGIEGEASLAGLRGQGAFSSASASGFVASHVNWLSTGTARVGYAFDRALPYVKGGLAFVRDGQEALYGIGPGIVGPVAVGNGGSVFGWTIGAGVEVAIDPIWSWKVEYDYINLGTNGVTLCVVIGPCSGPGSISAPFDIRQDIQSVVLGINYRFK
jgi:outer membrane immunogenic protein